MAALTTEITGVAKPPVVVDTSRRAVRVLQPQIEMPEIQEIFLVKAGDAEYAVYMPVGRVEKYGEYLRIPSGTEKYDVLLRPKDGQPVYLLRDFSLPERKVIDIRPEETFGLIRVEGTPPNERTFVVPAGASTAGVFSTTQRTDTQGQTMIVPAGKFDVYVGSNMFEAGLEVKAGELHRLQ